MVFDRSLLKAVRKKMRRLVTEDTVEGHLVRSVQALGGQCPKLMFLPGWPDRLVLLPGGIIAFIETKRPIGGKDEPLQPLVQRTLRKLGFLVYKAHTKKLIDDILEELTC